MHLNLKTDYGLRLLIFLALYPHELVPVTKVAGTFQISAHHLSKIAQRLAELGFVELVRGRGGGMRLLADPAHVSIHDVVSKVEESLALVECFDTKTNTCSISPACALKSVLVEAQSAFFAVLKRYTLADIVRNPKALRGILGRISTAH